MNSFKKLKVFAGLALGIGLMTPNVATAAAISITDGLNDLIVLSTW